MLVPLGTNLYHNTFPQIISDEVSILFDIFLMSSTSRNMIPLHKLVHTLLVARFKKSDGQGVCSISNPISVVVAYNPVNLSD